MKMYIRKLKCSQEYRCENMYKNVYKYIGSEEGNHGTISKNVSNFAILGQPKMLKEHCWELTLTRQVEERWYDPLQITLLDRWRGICMLKNWVSLDAFTLLSHACIIPHPLFASECQGGRVVAGSRKSESCLTHLMSGVSNLVLVFDSTQWTTTGPACTETSEPTQRAELKNRETTWKWV